MAIAKKAETEIKAAETAAAPVEEKAAEKKAPAKKAPAKKAAEKKTAAKKAPAEKKTAAKKATATVYVQYLGAELTTDEIIAKAIANEGVKSPKTVKVYVKPEENKVYYVIDGNEGSFFLV